ncbi:tetratricopeptide repeat protein [Haloferula sp.]|uniref:tetratricopeptide repeat protein n=1 Tax=Haloferula sp. TaxID=2497595 RepID=UPI003C747DD2
MNHKSYSRALIALALIFVPVPDFSGSGIQFAPMSILLFQTVKLGFEVADAPTDLGIKAIYLISFAGMVVYSLICGAIIVAIFRKLDRWTSSIKSPKLKRAAATALLCLPVAVTLAPIYRWDQAPPKNLWMAIRGEFARKQVRDRDSRLSMEDFKHRQRAEGMFSNAESLVRQGKSAEAEHLYRETLELERAKYRAEDHEDGKDHTALSLRGLAWNLHQLGKYEEAESTMREAVAISKNAEYHASLAELLSLQGKHDDAESAMREAVAIMKRSLKEGRRQGFRVDNEQKYLRELAELLSLHAKHDEAEALLREIFDQNPRITISVNDLAEELRRGGKFTEAEYLCREAIVMLDLSGEGYWTELNRLTIYITQACILRDQGKYIEADALFEQLLAAYNGNPNVAVPVELSSGYAESLVIQGQFARALPLAGQVLEFREKSSIPGFRALAEALDSLAGIHTALGNTKDAESLATRATMLRGKSP